MHSKGSSDQPTNILARKLQLLHFWSLPGHRERKKRITLRKKKVHACLCEYSTRCHLFTEHVLSSDLQFITTFANEMVLMAEECLSILDATLIVLDTTLTHCLKFFDFRLQKKQKMT